MLVCRNRKIAQVPSLLCEVLGMSAYYDYDGDGYQEILSTDRSMPFTGYTIYKFDLEHHELRYADLLKRLQCDGVDYDTHRGLFFTYHMVEDGNQEIQRGDGNIYALEGRAFVCRYTPS
ncbi:MAG: hypothetical protein LBT60_06140 [Oscillospiraceae bacterium]|nr:hypothetical protein [Oscillospiraceae bacterium]